MSDRPPFTVEVVSPETITYTGEADKVLVRTVGGGEIEFLAGHVPFVGILQISEAFVEKPDGERDYFALHRGFVQVAGNEVSILTDVSERAEEIDIERARAALGRAETADKDDADAQAAKRRAETRLKVAGELTAH